MGDRELREGCCVFCGVDLAEIATLRAENERLRGRVPACQAEVDRKDERLNTLRARVAELEATLRVARDAIASTPEDTFGHVDETGQNEGWFVRDELVYNISTAMGGTDAG